MGPGQKCDHGTLNEWGTNKLLATVACTDDRTISVKIDKYVAGSMMRFNIYSNITDKTQASYSDTGTITANGVNVKQTTIHAAWASGSAGGAGTTPTPTSTPTSTPTPTPTETQTPTPTATSTPTPTATTPAPTPTTPAPTATTPAPTATTPVPTSTTPAPAPTTPAPTPSQTPAPKPTPTPTRTPTREAKPAYVTRTFQVDRYTPKTAAAAALTARLDDDRRLTYREDRGLWGMSRWAFITVKVPAKATTAQLIAAINATTGPVGDIRTTAQLGRIAPRTGVTMAWELGSGATRALPWGPKRNASQIYIGRS